MLFGGNSGSCGGCGCKSCQECRRTCTNPHTGTAFETVYTLYFEGAEAGNPSDGYLDATGDSDTSDPYDGMDGNGPWFQSVSGTYTLSPTTTRHPCFLIVSFWRSNFVLGAATIPAPSQSLTSNAVTVTNLEGSGGAIVLDDGTVLAPGESKVLSGSVPLVAGSGDQSANDPRSHEGTFSVRAACGNESVTFSIEALIVWNVKKRQHVLYGLVRECYAETGFCDTFCGGSPAPDHLYVTLSNVSLTGGRSVRDISGTYVLGRTSTVCDVYESDISAGCMDYLGGLSSQGRDVGIGVILDTLLSVKFSSFIEGVPSAGSSVCSRFLIKGGALSSAVELPATGTKCDLPRSGTADVVATTFFGSYYQANTVVGTIDWEITS